MLKQIAILATGDELITGDVLNTSTAIIAKTLTELGFEVTAFMTVLDNQTDIEKALHYLFAFNKVIITTGGLGPTCDDITRFAITNVLALPLVFDETSWTQIGDMLKKYNVPLTENNRQQALFPEGSIIYANANGTANACKSVSGEKIVYMLPGPPFECMDLFNHDVLPDLLSLNLHETRLIKRWRLFGVSESAIADKIEATLTGKNYRIGYRIDYPYLEVKLFADNRTDLDAFAQAIYHDIKHYLLVDDYLTASELLIKTLSNAEYPVYVIDAATRGFMAHHLFSKLPLPVNIRFAPEEPWSDDSIIVKIEGLKALWDKPELSVEEIKLKLSFEFKGQHFIVEAPVPLRSLRSVRYAAEISCAHIYRYLQRC